MSCPTYNSGSSSKVCDHFQMETEAPAKLRNLPRVTWLSLTGAGDLPRGLIPKVVFTAPGCLPDSPKVAPALV